MSLPSALNPVPPHFSSFISSATLEIIGGSGPDQKRFLVHSNILSAQSESFRRTITRAPQEIDLSDWDSGTVGRFVEFLYIGNYQFPELTPEEEEADEEDDGRSGGVDTPDTPDTVQSRVDQVQPRKIDTNALLVHARLYALAQDNDVEALRSMALQRLRTDLKGIDGRLSRGAPGAMTDFIRLLDYVSRISSHADSHLGPQEQIQDIVSLFAAKNFERLMNRGEMRLLLTEGFGFTVELMEKVGVRLSETEREMQELNLRAAVLEKKVLRLEAANAQMQEPNVVPYSQGSFQHGGLKFVLNNPSFNSY